MDFRTPESTTEREARVQATLPVASECDRLRVAIDETRQRIQEVLFETDDIVLQQNPRIESEYAVKIGCYENECLQSQVAMRRAKRKLTLARVSANKGMPLNAEAIENALDGEFAQWEAEVEAQVRAHFETLDYRASCTTMSAGESKELKSLYRQLSKRLHPDLNPGQEEWERRLYAVAQTAYGKGDVMVLKALRVCLETDDRMCGRTADDLDTDSEEELRAELGLLEAQLAVVQERLDEIKQAAPFCLADQLANGRWVCERVTELQEATETYNQAAKEYRRRYDELWNEVSDEV